MKIRRRNFLRAGSVLFGGSFFLPFIASNAEKRIAKYIKSRKHLSPEIIAGDEDFWFQVSKSYSVSPDFTNLENGYFSLMPDVVLRAQQNHIVTLNSLNSWFMRNEHNKRHLRVKSHLAEFAGVNTEELAIVRNTTEAMNILFLGIDLPKEAEIVYNIQDYFRMKQAIQQRAHQEGISSRMLELKLHTMHDAEIVRAYENALSDKTKLLLVTHLVNVTGQVLPVRKIIEMAKSNGVEVIVDGAHSFAHFPFKIPDLGCDYFGCSLHKWLGAPMGTGLLYVKKEKIEKVKSLYGCTEISPNDIEKFEFYGTYAVPSHLAISNALQFHQAIGTKRIAARLHHLKNYWIEQVKGLNRISINTPVEAGQSYGIANFSIDGMEPSEIQKKLMDEFRIHVVGIDGQGLKGVRVTPHLYTLERDLDRLVEAIKKIS